MRKLGFVVLWCTVSLIGTEPVHAAFPGANGKIAFPHWQNVMTINPDGTGLQSATNTAIDKGDPAWSPDGRRSPLSAAPSAARS